MPGHLEFKPITAALLTGLLKKSLPDHVNVVNAPHLAKERGIRVSETISSDVEDYSSLITVELTTDKVQTPGGWHALRPERTAHRESR